MDKDFTDDDAFAVSLWAVGDAVRLKILSILPFSEDCESRSNVSEISERLGIPQPTVSHHLRVLRQAGVVKVSKKCRDCIYWIDSEEGGRLVEKLQKTLQP